MGCSPDEALAKSGARPALRFAPCGLQENLMPTKSDLIRKYFAAYRTKDRKVLEDGLAEDFTFTSPYDDAIDKAAYFERCWPLSTSGQMTNEIERIFEQG